MIVALPGLFSYPFCDCGTFCTVLLSFFSYVILVDLISQKNNTKHGLLQIQALVPILNYISC